MWEDIISDIVSKRMPHSDDIAGIRICDKSRNDPIIRREVWLKFANGDKDPRGIAIKNFVIAECFEKH